MSPQRSNRAQLIEGTLLCLERLPAQEITARAIAEAAGANVASITYHFGSKDDLVTEAAIAGFDRWLTEVSASMGEVVRADPAERFRIVARVVAESRDRHAGLVKVYLASLAKAQHNERIRATLAEGFWRARENVAAVLGLGDDQQGADAAGLALAMFHGLLYQSLLDPALAIDGDRLAAAQAKLAQSWA